MPVERRIDVVVAEDDGAFAECVRAMVDEQPRLTVVGVAADGLEAIELVDKLGPHAVVIDLHMPLLDGVNAIARLRREHPHLCLIALTGDSDAELHEAVRRAGADAVLEKGEIVGLLIDRLTKVRTGR